MDVVWLKILFEDLECEKEVLKINRNGGISDFQMSGGLRKMVQRYTVNAPIVKTRGKQNKVTEKQTNQRKPNEN